MAIPINIEDLLNKRKIEGNRIEFKKGWNPTDIYHSICAFANDFDNLGGGYLLVGVEQQDNGLAKRPVAGINIEEVDHILKQMIGLNNMFDPYYLPRTSVEEVDGNPVLVIWAPSGVNRPYAIPADVLSKVKKMKYYVRRSTGIPTIQEELLKNGSPRATFETNDERSFINVFIPVHEDCGDTVILNDTQGVPQSVPQGVPQGELDAWIVEQIRKNPKITTKEMGKLCGLNSKTIQRHITKLPNIQYIGSGYSGHWEIVDEVE